MLGYPTSAGSAFPAMKRPGMFVPKAEENPVRMVASTSFGYCALSAFARQEP